MSEKRRDKKGRILRNGECQRKDGMYQFDYVDLNGKPKCVYSWKLEPTDPLPKGKRECLSLREKEKEIKKAIDSGIVPNGGGYTLLQLVEKYFAQRDDLKTSTRETYQYTLNVIAEEAFAHRQIDKIKTSDAKEWFIKMQDKDGRKFSQLNSIKCIITPAFQMAVEDDLLVKNPFKFSLVKIIKNNTKPREPLSKEQALSFFNFLKNDSCYGKYYDAVYILFNTGLRISELCGLTIGDVDLDNKIFHITHQIHRSPKMKFSIESPKTDSGIRSIPMTDEVYECFKRIIVKRKKNPLNNEPVVKDAHGNKYTYFLFITERGTLTTACHWDKRINCMVGKYNRTHTQKIIKLTPHICRHSCASQYVAKGSNIKDLQYLLGHSKYEITANTYVKTNIDNVIETVENIKSLYE